MTTIFINVSVPQTLKRTSNTEFHLKLNTLQFLGETKQSYPNAESEINHDVSRNLSRVRNKRCLEQTIDAWLLCQTMSHSDATIS